MKNILTVAVLLMACFGLARADDRPFPSSPSLPALIGLASSSETSTTVDLQRRVLVLEAVVPRLRDRLRECEGAERWSGEFRVGAGADRLTLWGDDRPVSAVVEGKLTSPPFLGRVTASVLARHFFDDDGYWKRKRKVVVGLQAPVGPGVSLFADWERAYSGGDDFTIAGLSWRFGKPR